MYYLDLYGLPIQFTYKKSSVYGTACGLITSLIVVVIIIVYIVLYSVDLAEMGMPTVLNVPEYYNSPQNYTFMPNIVLNGTEVLPDLYKDNNQTGFLQLMIGIYDEKKKSFTDINKDILKLEVIDGKNLNLAIEKCNAMKFIPKESFDFYNLANTKCVYSPFNLQSDSINEDHSSVEIRLTCPESESECNKNISNYELYFMYINTLFNQTNSNEPIVRYVDWKSIVLSPNNEATISAFFQINKLTSYTNIMPKSMTSSKVEEHYVSFDEDKYSNTPKKIGESKIVASIKIQLSDSRNQYERTYQNLFDIVGKIGGFSKIIFLIGSVFVFYSAKIRLKESLINDFYSVVDPIYTDKVNKDFNGFLQEIKDGTYEYSQNAKIAMNEKILCDFYRQNEFFQKLLIVQTKINKNQIEAAEKAEYNISKIVYQLYINVIYSGLYYSTADLLANFFACCCRTKTLKDKNIVFKKALKALEKDTDFLSILGCVQNFETIKATFLKKETQLSLFKALANKPFASSTIYKEMKSKEKGEKKNGEEKSLDIETLFNNLQELTKDEKKTLEDLKWDEKLVSNLVEDKHKENADNLINNMKEIIQEREDKKQSEINKKDNAKKLELTKEDYEKINRKFE